MTTSALGGTHRGAVMADEVARRHPLFVTPKFRTIPVERLTARDFAAAAAQFGRGISVRYSGVREAFSPYSRRGANTGGIRLTYEESLECDENLVEHVRTRAPQGTKAVLLQELVPLQGALQRVIAYVEAGTVLIEVHRTDGSTRLFVRGQDGRVFVEETCPTDDPREQSLETTLPDALLRLAHSLNLELDIEGFWDGRRFILLQLRPVPDDRPLPPAGWQGWPASDTSKKWHTTRFAWGFFSLTGNVSTWEHCRGSAAHQLTLGHRWAEDCLPLVPDDGGEPVVVDLRRGFHLEHSTPFLPRPAEARAGFRYVSVATWRDAPLVRPGVRLATSTDGRTARIRILS